MWTSADEGVVSIDSQTCRLQHMVPTDLGSRNRLRIFLCNCQLQRVCREFHLARAGSTTTPASSRSSIVWMDRVTCLHLLKLLLMAPAVAEFLHVAIGTSKVFTASKHRRFMSRQVRESELASLPARKLNSSEQSWIWQNTVRSVLLFGAIRE